MLTFLADFKVVKKENNRLKHYKKAFQEVYAYAQTVVPGLSASGSLSEQKAELLEALRYSQLESFLSNEDQQ